MNIARLYYISLSIEAFNLPQSTCLSFVLLTFCTCL
uniref:Uncharacterized protein n=1 Tax=Rhizophora mucronata TaxID=61149 RepID=A0A2P2P5Y3_RHIMU